MSLSMIDCSSCCWIIQIVLPLVLVLVLLARHVKINKMKHASRDKFHIGSKTKFLAFFHPFCASGGGGERVLWKMIHSLSELHKEKKLNVSVVIYTAAGTKTREDILNGACDRFGIDVGKSMKIHFVFIPTQIIALMTAEAWPRFTMIGQSIGTLAVAWHGLTIATPDTYIDTTGAAFTMPLAKLLFGAKCVCYTHYPTISTDMLKLVYERRSSYNHDADVSSSKLKSALKLAYYCFFAFAYAIAGTAADLVMVNSSWTCGHIAWLWRWTASKPIVLYPPCAVDEFALASTLTEQEQHQQSLCQHFDQNEDVDQKDSGSNNMSFREIVSVAQFRPEKDHELQLKAFSQLIKSKPSKTKNPNPNQKSMFNPKYNDVKLMLLGSCRDEGDADRVTKLKELAKKLEIEHRVEFILNVPFLGKGGVINHLQRARVGLHTMWNEHFGIGVVEMMAAGCIVVAHSSAGPLMDIVVPTLSEDKLNGVGFLANDVDSFATQMAHALDLDRIERSEVIERALIHSRRFSDESFSDSLYAIINGAYNQKHAQLF